MKKNKSKNFFIFKSFICEEKKLSLIIVLSLLLILIYVFTNKIPEIISFGSELMIAIYDISIAFLVGVILYYLQIFLPRIKKRKNAQRELNIIINDLTGLISLIISNYYSQEELWKNRFSNNPSKYIYENIDKVSKYIGNNLKLDDVMKFGWNKKERKTFRDEFFKAVKKFNKNYREIILKYGDCLEEITLDSLEKIYRIREDNYLIQDIIHESVIKKLLINMQIIQKSADKINYICK